MYDPVEVRTGTADEDAASNGLITSGGILLIHKATLTHADGTGALTLGIVDGVSAGVTAKFTFGTNEVTDDTAAHFDRYKEVNFNPPLPIQVGLSLDLTGTGTWQICYTRG